MAAVSAPQAHTSLTPPSSSHGSGQNSWNYSVPAQPEDILHSKMGDYSNPPPLTQMNGNPLNHQNSRPDLSQRRADTSQTTRAVESGFLAPARVNALARKDSSISEAGSAPDSLLDLYGTNRSGVNSVDLGERKMEGIYADDEDPEHSRWIHRDKLARIESQELQAAGIILPRGRATSKSSRREQSRDHQRNRSRSEQGGQKRQRIGSYPEEEPEEPEEPEDNGGWELRLPEEVAQDTGDLYRDMSGGVKGVSRIPVLTTSPIPIPLQHLERDTPMKRTHSGGWTIDDDGLSYQKSRGRSDSVKPFDDAGTTPTPAKRQASENSPTKKPALRKGSTPGTRTPSAQRPKTRSGPGRETSGTQRPTTRSGELGHSNSIKRPEGDPPWLASMYKPDPRLPPDQQLLPTVAKRLQQEQWEKEGKFGNAYDTSFRPLNDEQLPQPEPTPSRTPEAAEQKLEQDSEWPLRAPAPPKSPVLSAGRPGTAGGYSTIPRITGQGQPQGVGPLPSPNTAAPTRVQNSAEETKEKEGGCGCCVVM
ncbi:hypothetical protein B0O99DRAFT_511083 [Bisporella sp. PMI_857]|nr:hypothetical protein B0O99DRAFT_511083 [Bisporella sp. PMI_857]